MWRGLTDRFLEIREWLRGFDFGQIGFEHGSLAIMAAILVFVIFLFKFVRFILGRRGDYRTQSGHFIPKSLRENFLERFLHFLPKFLLAFGIACFITAIAGPFVYLTSRKEIIESRERIDLLDVSTSMGWPFLNTGKSEGEIAREAHLKFLEMRRNQNDRVAFWLFTTNPYKVEDFTIDADLYMFQVANAPYVITGPDNPWLPENNSRNDYLSVIAPKDKIRLIPWEGGTNLKGGLRAVINYFDEKGDKKIKRRALLLITDGASDTDPTEELLELKRRNINLYLVFVKPNEMGEKQHGGGSGLTRTEALLRQIAALGWHYYYAHDKNALKKAFDDINKLETIKIEVKRGARQLPIFDKFLLLGLFLVMISCFLALGLEIFWRRNP